MSPVEMETVLIADDHELIRRGVRMILESLPQQYKIIEVATCAQVLQVLSAQHVHHMVLDMQLADGNLFSALHQIGPLSEKTNILVYTMNAEKIYARRLMQKGVKGFVSKQAPIQDLESAIRCLIKGEVYLSPAVKDELFRNGKTHGRANPIDALSDRELEVVEYVAIGMGAKEIANKMNLDITTVSTYRRRAFEKLNVQNVIELKDKFLLYKTQE